MELLKIDRESLLKSLQAVDGIIEPNKKQTMPILANTLIQVKDNQLSFLGSDLELQIKAVQKMSGDEFQDADFSLTVEAHKFLSIVKALPEKSTIKLSLSADDEKLTVQCGSSKYNLQTLPAEDFPIINRIASDYSDDEDDDEEYSYDAEENNSETPSAETRVISISSKELRHLLSRVNYAMAVADMRTYLNGVFFKFAEKTLNVVATDGHRLGFINTQEHIANDNVEGTEFILPRKAVLELIKLIPQNVSENQTIELSVANNSVTFSLSLEEGDDAFKIDFVSKLIDGRFPDYNRVIPKGLEQTVVIPRQQLIKALQRVSILADKRFNGTKLEFSSNVLDIVAKNSEQEEAREQIDIELELE